MTTGKGKMELTNQNGIKRMKPQICPHCKAIMKVYSHKLNRPLAQALFRLATRPNGRGSISHIGLTHSQICNFHKLRYWELVEKIEGGVWQVTNFGRMFLENTYPVYERVLSYRGKLSSVDKNSKQVKFSDYLDFKYERREDYVQNSTGILFP